ncbi:cell death regulator Aven isoform X2 [Lampris incognitus]|uniref:cell death regulator Aven isoform X2 n=1 Tax=Lampris incognitus TaxID=2546036 RepID=UPI0024B62442|nr:cell death regulator Aven isoform X2 [Lampris incognitus]
MEWRASRGRGRGGGWGRGGGQDGDGSAAAAAHRGRGRGGHNRGRGKREHHRGRGRGGGPPAAFERPDQDEGNNPQPEDEGVETFSRRKLESNWDRYKESEKVEPDDDMPTQRGTDYHVLLESAGDSFTQFRFSEEKDWEMDSLTTSQMSAVFLDLPALAQSLQEVPLHQRLNLEAELVQVSTPVELPAITVAPKQNITKTASDLKGLKTSFGISLVARPECSPAPQVSTGATKPLVDDVDEELDQLLTLQKPVSDTSGNHSVSMTDEEVIIPEPENVKEAVPEVMEEKLQEAKDKVSPPPKAVPVKQEVTEEDLEDWLDSMIS